MAFFDQVGKERCDKLAKSKQITTAMTIAIVSTLISSIALAGVAISLLLQARQLRSSQLQASRAAQAELIRMAVDNPKLVSETLDKTDSDAYLRSVFVNWSFKYMELSYSVKAISAESVRVQAAMLFDAKYPRDWWVDAREVYKVEAATKRERQFFAIVDGAFDRAIRLHHSDGIMIPTDEQDLSQEEP